MNFLYLCIFIFVSLFSFNLFSEEPNFVQEHSLQVESSKTADIETLFKNLSPTLPQTNFLTFSRGKIYISQGNLIWRDLGGLENVLVSSLDVAKGQAISGFEISPDGKKVAFNTAENGQDLKYWNIVEISKTPKILMKEPALNRMEGFSWGLNSQGFYYSFWNDKEDVKNKLKPIIEARYRNIFNQTDEVIFAPGYAENFGMAETNLGETIFAYRLLSLSAGIKTTFSLFKSTRDKYGRLGKWTKAYPRNEYVGLFLGIYNNSAVILTSKLGDTYGVEAVGAISGQSEVIIPAVEDKVLHIAEIKDDSLILQYHSVDTQNVSVVIYNLKTKTSKTTEIGSLGLTPFGDLGRFKFGPGGKIARAVFSDVMQGDQALELDLSLGTITRLQNQKNSEFNNQDYEHRIVRIKMKDGSEIQGRLYYPKNKKPEFIFIRHYGWIAIKNYPETKEVQAALELGGAYFTAEIPGGGERGADWFLSGSRNRLETMGYLAEVSDHLQKELKLTKDKVVTMGRSWGGLNSLILAAKYSSHFGIIAPVVPVIDLNDAFENGWFGRISHSDLAPEIDGFGNYILDDKFQKYVESINPLSLINQIPSDADIYLFTTGADDRVDQGGLQEVEFAKKLELQLGANKFRYHRSVFGNHSARHYQLLLFSLIAKKYNLSVSNQTTGLSCQKYLAE